jgi:hypothetical protein
LLRPTTLNNHFTKCDFHINYFSSNDNAGTTENEEDWHSLETHGFQSDNYTMCGSVLDLYEVQTVGHTMDKQLAKPEQQEEK